MKEILTIERTNSLIRIPKKWIDDNIIPGSSKVQILRELDGDRIIITPIQPTGETDNANITHTTKENEKSNLSTDTIS